MNVSHHLMSLESCDNQFPVLFCSYSCDCYTDDIDYIDKPIKHSIAAKPSVEIDTIRDPLEIVV